MRCEPSHFVLEIFYLSHFDHLHHHLIGVLRLQVHTHRADLRIFCSKSEYVIYKLKEMGKVSDKDIMQICKTFDRLDTGKGGKITLADLMKGHLWVYRGGFFFSLPSWRARNSNSAASYFLLINTLRKCQIEELFSHFCATFWAYRSFSILQVLEVFICRMYSFWSIIKLRCMSTI